MWPIIMNLARSYAPQLVFPAACVAGFIGEKVKIEELRGKLKYQEFFDSFVSFKLHSVGLDLSVSNFSESECGQL